MLNILTATIPLPPAIDFFASSTEWTTPMVEYFLPLVILTVGVALAFFVFRFIVGIFHK